MDSIDKKIISLLNLDGRTGNNTIARKLGISEGTVRNRIRKLTDGNMLRIVGQINPETVADRQLFILGAKIATSKDLSKAAREVSKLKEVQAVYITTGRYDLMIEVWLSVKHGLIEFIDGAMGKIDGIVSTESFLAMTAIKKWIDVQE